MNVSLRLTLPVVFLSIAGCEKPKHFTTTMEVLQIEPFKDEKGATTTVGLELRYAECPGDARRILRADKKFASCAGPLKSGDKIKAELVSTWQSDKGSYRSDVVKLGECTLKQDPKDEANYEMVNTCSDVVTTGAVVGIRCDRTRSKELVDKCPWLKRK
ncbi:MAG TPA: hypothetical protein VM925_00420 [Labilithrix sp.]|nr:hypothetical protein [Labilithrix sp.]